MSNYNDALASHALKIVQQSREKADFPSEVTNWLYGYPIGNVEGVFLEVTDDIISDLSSGGNIFNRWIPAKAENSWLVAAQHLSFVIPEGFDGSVTYMQHLIGEDDIAECDYGPGADYSVYAYASNMHKISFSNKNNPISAEVGLKKWAKSSRKFLRGARQGQSIATERDWVLAMLTERLESHMDWNVIWGNPYVSASSNKNMSEGLDLLIRKGYVQDHLIGGGQAVFCDPDVYYGMSITDPVAQLRRIITGCYKIIERMIDRGSPPKPSDIGLFMTSAHWRVYSEVLAAGALTKLYSASSNLEITPEVVQRELERVRNSGGIDVYGTFVPVYTENMLGRNTDMPDGSGPGVIGDIYFLTKRFRGMDILTQRYLDWNNADLSKNPEERMGPNLVTFMNGMIKTTYGYIDDAQECWWYGLKLYTGLFCTMFPLQGKFVSFVVPSDIENEIEHSNYAHQDFYAYSGGRGGYGNSLIEGLGS